MATSAPIHAVLYSAAKHLHQHGDVYKIKGQKYFFDYNYFPHGHIDCPRGSSISNWHVIAFVEQQRINAFAVYGIASRGLTIVTRMIENENGIYSQTMTKIGKIFESKVM